MMEILAMIGAFLAMVVFAVLFFLWVFMGSDTGITVVNAINWILNNGLAILIFSVIFIVLLAIQIKIVQGTCDIDIDIDSPWIAGIAGALVYAPIPVIMYNLWDASVPHAISICAWLLPLLFQIGKAIEGND